MNVIEQVCDRVRRFRDKLESGVLVQNIIYENETWIIELNSEQQLYTEGINALGVDIMDYAPYSPYTIAIKKEKGQPTNRVTLRDEGDFEESFFLEVGTTQFEIRAADWKTQELIKKYGRNILGLTVENIGALIWEYIYPDLLKQAKEEIYG